MYDRNFIYLNFFKRILSDFARIVNEYGEMGNISCR